jgi:DNA helicase IV
MHWHLFKEYMPEVERFKPDYKILIKKIDELECEARTQHLIIDEGQDMPPPFYDALMHAGYENFFIVADQNQQITDDHSSREDLTIELELEPKDVIELKINYRNSYPIALFASHFYTDKASPPPDLPDRASLETPSLYTELTNENISTMIFREADKDDRKLIGVVVANDMMRDSYVNSMRNLDIALDNSHPVISTYSSKEKKSVSIDFSQGGIVILNDKSIKGLEFDIVYIILDGFKVYNNDQTSMKKRLYVMSSRAIEKLTLVNSQDNPTVLSLLPTDEKIMKTVVGFKEQPKPEVDDFNEDVLF